MKENNGPKILAIDIETSPLTVYTWGLFDQNIGLNQIKEDWSILSYSAKWVGSKKIVYEDTSREDNVRNDSKLLKNVWKLLNEADIVLSQNGKRFDTKKLNARFIMNRMPPPSNYKHIDTLVLAKKYFGLTSNKLEYMTDKLCIKYKKLQHKKFPGFELWSECLKGNKSAWSEMKKYNIHDVLALEELYTKIQPGGVGIDFNLYRPEISHICNCGSRNVQRRGFEYTSVGKFQRYQCTDCGKWSKDSGKQNNLLSPEKRRSLKK